MLHINLIFLILSFISGEKSNLLNQILKTNNIDIKLNNNSVNNYEKIEGAIGLIVENECYQFGDIIHVFNVKHKLIKKIILTEEKQILHLRCLSKNKFYYKVEFEDEKIGFIPRNEKGILFQTWDEHILSLFAVNFNESKNPLLKAPFSNAEQIQYDKDEIYQPNKIKGEWLQVKFGTVDNLQFAWIKWRDKDKLLIEMFYFA